MMRHEMDNLLVVECMCNIESDSVDIAVTGKIWRFNNILD